MLVSVITICFNSEAVIRKTIESVLNQTWDKLEYLIVDGASKDRTVAIAEEYSERFAAKGVDYRIYSEPDRGIYDAMNKGIRLSSGDLVGLINSGDWYESDAVETAVKAYEKEPYDLFYADINLIKENGSVMVKHSKKDRFPTSRHWNHPTMFVTRKTYQELGLYRNEGIHDDFEFYLRARKAGKIITIVNKTIANFVTGGASNAKSFAKCKKRCLDRYRDYRINGYSRLAMVECIAIEAAKYILS